MITFLISSLSFYTSGARISTVTDVGPGVVGDLRVADRRDVAECPLLALDPRRDPGSIMEKVRPTVLEENDEGKACFGHDFEKDCMP